MSTSGAGRGSSTRAGLLALAVIAVSAASLAWLPEIYRDSRWEIPTAAAIVLTTLCGLLGRRLTQSSLRAAGISLLLTALLGTALVLLATGTFRWNALEWPGILRELADVGFIEADTFVIPTRTTTGLLAVTVGGALLLTWTIDALAATWRSGALALIPALTAVGVGLVTLSGAVPAWTITVFVLAAALLLAAAGSPLVRTRGSARSTAAVAAAIALTAAASATLAFRVAPSDPSGWLSGGSGGGAGDRLNLLVSLDAREVNSGTTPLLRYRVQGTAREQGGYLRLVTYSEFDGTAWLPAERGTYPVAGIDGTLSTLGGSVRIENGSIEVYLDGELVSTWPVVPGATPTPGRRGGLAEDSPFSVRSATTRALGEISRWEITVAAPGFTALPAPAGAMAVESTSTSDVGGWRWRTDDRTLMRTGTDDPVAYTLLAQAAYQSPDPGDPRNLALPTDVADVVSPYAAAARGDASTVPSIGAALVDYLTGPDFTYTLAVAYAEGATGMQQFLESGDGFCQQFATAMAVMARTLGIPSRVVVGFTQGSPGDDDEFTVTGSNLHAWVELYDAAAGTWLTFDPTPASAAGPGRPADREAARDEGADATATATAPAAPTRAPQIPDSESTTSGSGASSTSDGTFSQVLAALPSVLGAVTAIGAIVLLLSAPSLLRRRRRRARMTAGTASAAWSELLDTARDHGIAVHPGMPSAIAQSLLLKATADRRAAVAGEDAAALTALRQHADRERYGAPPPASSDATDSPGLRDRSAGGTAVLERSPAATTTITHRWRRLIVESAPTRERWRARLAPRSVLTRR